MRPMTARRAQDSGGASAECCWPIWTYVINCFHVKECFRSVHRSRPIFWQVSTERSVYVCVEVGNKWWTDGGAKIANEKREKLESFRLALGTARTAPYRTAPYRLPGRLLDPLARVLAWLLCQSSSSQLPPTTFFLSHHDPKTATTITTTQAGVSSDSRIQGGVCLCQSSLSPSTVSRRCFKDHH